MTHRSRRWSASALVALTALGVFSIVFSLLAERGLWPQLPPGALHDTDLVAGFIAGIALIALLAARRGENPRLTEGPNTASDRGNARTPDPAAGDEPPDRGIPAGGDSLG